MYTTLPKKGQAPLVVEMWVTCEPLGCCEGGGKSHHYLKKTMPNGTGCVCFFILAPYGGWMIRCPL